MASIIKSSLFFRKSKKSRLKWNRSFMSILSSYCAIYVLLQFGSEIALKIYAIHSLHWYRKRFILSANFTALLWGSTVCPKRPTRVVFAINMVGKKNRRLKRAIDGTRVSIFVFISLLLRNRPVYCAVKFRSLLDGALCKRLSDAEFFRWYTPTFIYR